MGQIILFEHIDTIIIVFIYHNHRKMVKKQTKVKAREQTLIEVLIF